MYRYPMAVENKNGHSEFLAHRVYITSNIGWRNWWGEELLKNKNNVEAIERRITVEKHFDQVYVAPEVNDPVLALGADEHQLQRQNAIVGRNTLSELYCDEDQSFLDHTNGNQADSFWNNAPLSPLGQAYFDAGRIDLA